MSFLAIAISHRALDFGFLAQIAVPALGGGRAKSEPKKTRRSVVRGRQYSAAVVAYYTVVLAMRPRRGCPTRWVALRLLTFVCLAFSRPRRRDGISSRAGRFPCSLDILGAPGAYPSLCP